MPTDTTTEATGPTPVKQQHRICFSIYWYATEEQAQVAHERVQAADRRYNGGYFHGMLCGRDTSFDSTDEEGNKIFAVTG